MYTCVLRRSGKKNLLTRRKKKKHRRKSQGKSEITSYCATHSISKGKRKKNSLASVEVTGKKIDFSLWFSLKSMYYCKNQFIRRCCYCFSVFSFPSPSNQKKKKLQIFTVYSVPKHWKIIFLFFSSTNLCIIFSRLLHDFFLSQYFMSCNFYLNGSRKVFNMFLNNYYRI